MEDYVKYDKGKWKCVIENNGKILIPFIEKDIIVDGNFKLNI